MRKMLLQLVAPALVALGLSGTSAFGQQYIEDFNTDPPPGVEFRGSAGYRASGSHDGSGYGSITDALGGQQGKILLPDFTGGIGIQSFTATMKVRIGGGTCCGTRTADGISFNFAPASDAAVLDGAGGGWCNCGAAPGAAEEGTGTGISITLDTWDNGNGDGPSMEIKANGRTMAKAHFAGTREANSGNPPIQLDGSGNPMTIQTGDEFVDLVVTKTSCNTVSVSYKGVLIFDNVPAPVEPFVGRFIFGGRTGGANDNQWVDDIVIDYAEDNAVSPYISNVTPGFTGGSTQPTISYSVTERGVAVGDVVMTVDGSPVAHTTTTAGSGPFVHTYSYTPPVAFAANSTHTSTLDFQDGDGISCGASYTFTVGQFGPGTLFIEAEDYNYESGKHANFGDPDGSLLGKVGTVGVDYVDNDVANNAGNQYRPADQIEAGKGPNNGGDSDRSRGDRTITADWVIGWTGGPTEWTDYTRDFGPGATYNVYIRWGSGAGAGTDMISDLHLVTSNPSQPNQQTVKLGTFFRTDPTGGWDNNYVTTPMTANMNSATPVQIRLKGVKTLRNSFAGGAYDWNYLLLIPDPNAPLACPTVSESPVDGSTTPNRSPLVKATVLDQDTFVDPASLRLIVNGVDVTSSSMVEDTVDGASISYQSTYPIGSLVTATVNYDDTSPSSDCDGSKTWSFRVGALTGEGALYIEVEDFNWSEQEGAGTCQYADFGSPDGSLCGKEATPGVDYFEVNDNNEIGGDPGAYRPQTGVEAGKGAANCGINGGGNDSADRGTRNITKNWVIGWNDDGDWFNYTRTVPAGTYNAYARLSSGCCDEDWDLSVVVSDPCSDNQVTSKLGNFFSDSTGNWDGFETVPLTDDNGDITCATAPGGAITLRMTKMSGASDANWIALVPVGAAPDVIELLPPDGSKSAIAPQIRATIQDGTAAGVVPSSVRLVVNGQDVTSHAEVRDTPCGVAVRHQLCANPGQTHTATLSWTDTAGNQGSRTWSFTEGIFSNNNLFIEAEDYNADNGTYLPSNGDVSTFNQKNLYAGLGAVHLVDYFDRGNGEANEYRTEEVGGEPNLGTVCNGDASVDTTGLGPRPVAREGFVVGCDYKIGWNDGGEWRNYTRNFPAGDYKIYSRASSGGGAIFSSLQLVSEPTVVEVNPGDQGLVQLGTFRAPSTANWDGFTFIALKDANGGDAIVHLEDVQTLRYTIDPGGNQDHQYLMLVPQGGAALGITCPGNQTVNDADNDCGENVSWEVSGTGCRTSCTPASGSRFPIGSTTVRCTTSDDFGSESCSFTVTVTDTTAPTMTCPGVVVGNDAGRCSAVVSDYGVTATDCSPTTVECTPPQGTTFPVGSTTVTCTATDSSGNSSSCTFVVVVEDREAPIVSARHGSVGRFKAKRYDPGHGLYQVCAVDNCDARSTVAIYIKDACSSFVAGPYKCGDFLFLQPNNGKNAVHKGHKNIKAYIYTDCCMEIFATDSNGNVSNPPLKKCKTSASGNTQTP